MKNHFRRSHDILNSRSTWPFGMPALLRQQPAALQLHVFLAFPLPVIHDFCRVYIVGKKRIQAHRLSALFGVCMLLSHPSPYRRELEGNRLGRGEKSSSVKEIRKRDFWMCMMNTVGPVKKPQMIRASFSVCLLSSCSLVLQPRHFAQLPRKSPYARKVYFGADLRRTK